MNELTMTNEQTLIKTLGEALQHANDWLRFIKEQNNGELPPFNWGFIGIEMALADLEAYKEKVSL